MSEQSNTEKKLSWIIVTGGVLSGLGKGVAAASIGNLLSEYTVTPIKCDGYLNVDPGTMNPVEHGEVFVLDDGGEVDMDFGHYERFLGVTCKRDWNLTMGKVFENVRKKERKGDYLGKTVQMIPHVTDYIYEHWKTVAQKENSDVLLVEIGGTVGDIENELYIEAAQKLRSQGEHVIFVHLTYVPLLANVNEQKTKPTQQSVALLRSRGIQPDIILARSGEQLQAGMKEKIARMCGLAPRCIIGAVDVPSVYEIPLHFAQDGFVELLKDFGLSAAVSSQWEENVHKVCTTHVKIAICGKYTALEDSYASVVEALHHAGNVANICVDVVWLDTTKEKHIEKNMQGIDGVIVPGGFGTRGIEGKIQVISYCRKHNIPYLGICYGLQMAVIEHARSLGLAANSTEVDALCKDPVVDILPEQKAIKNKGGTMRLGAYPAQLNDGIVAQLYDAAKLSATTSKSGAQVRVVSERHRHRYEVNPEYHAQLEKDGMVFCGLSPDGTLVEFLERSDQDFFVATQGHPELKSSPLKPAPLFTGLVVVAGMMRK